MKEITKEQAIYNISIYLQTGKEAPGFKSSLKLALRLLVKEANQ